MIKFLFITSLFITYFNITSARRDLNYKYRKECQKNLCLGPDTFNLLKKADLDHIIPLSKGGSNDEDNLMYIPKYLNQVFSNNDHTDLKNRLINFKGEWDQRDKGRFLNKNHPAYNINEYLYKNKDTMTSKERKLFLNTVNLNDKINNNENDYIGLGIIYNFAVSILKSQIFWISSFITCIYYDENGEYLCADEIINTTQDLYEEHEVSKRLNDTYHQVNNFSKHSYDKITNNADTIYINIKQLFINNIPTVNLNNIFNNIFNNTFNNTINNNYISTIYNFIDLIIHFLKIITKKSIGIIIALVITSFLINFKFICNKTIMLITFITILYLINYE